MRKRLWSRCRQSERWWATAGKRLRSTALTGWSFATHHKSIKRARIIQQQKLTIQWNKSENKVPFRCFARHHLLNLLDFSANCNIAVTAKPIAWLQVLGTCVMLLLLVARFSRYCANWLVVKLHKCVFFALMCFHGKRIALGINCLVMRGVHRLMPRDDQAFLRFIYY